MEEKVRTNSQTPLPFKDPRFEGIRQRGKDLNNILNEIRGLLFERLDVLQGCRPEEAACEDQAFREVDSSTDWLEEVEINQLKGLSVISGIIKRLTEF